MPLQKTSTFICDTEDVVLLDCIIVCAVSHGILHLDISTSNMKEIASIQRMYNVSCSTDQTQIT